MAGFCRGFAFERDVSAPLTIEGNPIPGFESTSHGASAQLPSGETVSAASDGELVEVYLERTGASRGARSEARNAGPSPQRPKEVEPVATKASRDPTNAGVCRCCRRLQWKAARRLRFQPHKFLPSKVAWDLHAVCEFSPGDSCRRRSIRRTP